MFKRSRAPVIRVVLTARSWRRLPMKLLNWRKMPSTKQYNLVTNDEYDTRIPLHPDEAFQYGITFHAKYIGTMDVPRPTNRVEIVAAMRRVRYEFKAKGVKKRQVTVDISTDGVKVSTRKPKSKSKKLFSRNKKKVTTECQEIMHHPIYRIFYVSHDSSDLKIFSYIARDGATNVFKCNVFKSNRKSQAMRIVRTVGQAFEVCHKMQASSSDQPAPSTSSVLDDQAPASDVPASKEAVSECGASESGAASTSKLVAEEGAVGGQDIIRPKHLDLLPPPPKKEGKKTQRTTASIHLPDLPECVTKVEMTDLQNDASTPLTSQHQLQLLKERLEQQAQQTRAAVAQLLLLRDQLAAEQAARCEAQARTHQLLVHNKELLEHIAALVAHLQERERGSSRPISAQQLTMLPQKTGAADQTMKTEKTICNGNGLPSELINLKANQNVENNNILFISSPSTPVSSTPCFGEMSNEQIQNYLISKFEDLSVVNGTDNNNTDSFKSQDYYQNSKAFPNIPLVNNHFSNSDLSELMQHHGCQVTIGGKEGAHQSMNIGRSELSLCSSSQGSSSKDSSPEAVSSDEAVAFIMPLSHNGTLTATGEDGRVRLIVPVSPSGSSTDVPVLKVESHSASGPTLRVPDSLNTQAGSITRTTSEKVPNRSEMMTALRSQWTRHTTK